jgi:hypothetical protein
MLTLPEIQAFKDRVKWQLRTDLSKTICLHPERHNPQDHKKTNNGTQHTISTAAYKFIDSTLYDDVKVKEASLLVTDVGGTSGVFPA